jgi:hypothetical protein
MGAHGSGRVIHASVNDLTVPRGNPGTDAVSGLGDDHVVPRTCCCSRNRKADDSCPNYQNLHGHTFETSPWCRMHGGAPGSGAPRANTNELKYGLYTCRATGQRR